jgi:hypothetical protein
LNPLDFSRKAPRPKYSLQTISSSTLAEIRNIFPDPAQPSGIFARKVTSLYRFSWDFQGICHPPPYASHRAVEKVVCLAGCMQPSNSSHIYKFDMCRGSDKPSPDFSFYQNQGMAISIAIQKRDGLSFYRQGKPPGDLGKIKLETPFNVVVPN